MTTKTTRPTPDTPAPPRTRTLRDPRQKAQDALDVAQRKVTRVTDQITHHETARDALHAELKHLEAERDYLAGHPALNPPTNTTDTDTDTEETP